MRHPATLPPAPHASEPPALLTADQAARYLNISPATFYRHVARRVPCVRLGTARRWRRADLDGWLAAQAAAAASEVAGDGRG